MNSSKNIAILGASNNPERYSYKAQSMLIEAGYPVFPINPNEERINGVKAYASIGDIDEKIDTLTIYVNQKILENCKEQIKQSHPNRVIFNPGTESPSLKKYLEDSGIQTVEACTLVLLRTGQF